ncbi:hypothetical protein B0T18DRAFT_442955 [Schizothecium vesticola]|uniref:Uncharacterized protein n=1 Tax=Schizothecium vesticola TaxID=314040 RepID=A0AA40FB99_9PEZI|nr:hypothetical protein B0T18DRAFT_442955 [Schizothecium vesticola]
MASLSVLLLLVLLLAIKPLTRWLLNTLPLPLVRQHQPPHPADTTTHPICLCYTDPNPHDADWEPERKMLLVAECRHPSHLPEHGVTAEFRRSRYRFPSAWLDPARDDRRPGPPLPSS